jgi:UDP-GlcNAc:undecaprenyl-phosphate GlcNAc-1-phosphate transferase
MQLELRLALAFVVAAAITWAIMPLVVRVAVATGFIDRPMGYKGHRAATPYLGGTAIMAGLVVAALALGDGGGTYAVVLGCAGAMWVVGTLDDRVNLSPFLRLALEAGVAVALWNSGHGWEISSDAVNLALTCIWVLAIVNAVNLMDNMDGAASTVVAVAAAAIGLLAALQPDPMLAALCFAIAGACAGFLPHNLARPARIFMGDGGSMPLGLLLASIAPAAASQWVAGTGGVATGALLVGLVILDTSLVMVSRRRGGRPLMSGGRDHLTHRLRIHLGSAQAVVVVLAAAQLALSAATVVLAVAAPGAELAFGLVAVVCAAWMIRWLDGPAWAEQHAIAALALEPEPVPATQS